MGSSSGSPRSRPRESSTTPLLIRGGGLQELVEYCQSLIEKCNDQERQLRVAEYDDQANTETRRRIQRELAETRASHEELVKENETIKNRNPYIAVLIDGDGLMFQNSWIEGGIEGGKKAATALRSFVADTFGKDIEGLEIIVKVVVNLTGLERVLEKGPLPHSPSKLKEFSVGFTQAKTSFDFIDVGFGKERADSKIREQAKWHLRNYNCRHVVLGISHDSGYAPVLDEIFHDDAMRQRVSVLEGVPTHKDIKKTRVNIVRAGPDLFRKDKITIPNHQGPSGPNNSDPPPAPKPSPPAANAIKATAASARSSPPIPKPDNAGTKVTAAASRRPSGAALTPQVQAGQTAQSSPEHRLCPPLQPDWNPGPKGFDPSVQYVPAVLEAVKARKDSDRLCMFRYINGKCGKSNKKCHFIHDYNISEEEKKALMVLARQTACKNGQECPFPGHSPSAHEIHRDRALSGYQILN
ncbi:hypothetical protein ESCO_005444 [Escovopsis weberi]|uniref:C3H1-type domain-containing protein n=1 Tax=Escovopsis weberi TaxID=150374 RepID=A0A0M9VUY4_ESCWE|nr:hypothetical protein ESCO_005444 [Escovopsis weberi]